MAELSLDVLNAVAKTPKESEDQEKEDDQTATADIASDKPLFEERFLPHILMLLSYFYAIY